MKDIYYDGTKLLSLKDKNGNKPEIYLCVGNRTAGKTVFFKRLLMNNYLSGKGKFIMLYRFNYELSSCVDMFFSDIKPLFFQDHDLRQKTVARGLFYEMYLDDEKDPCGYAIALSNADALKKYSSMFAEVTNIFLDEFQSETNHYAPEEIKKFQSIHVSIARGQGEQYRYIRTLLASNSVTMLNPYYKAMGIHKLLSKDTKFLRGDGWVMEQTFNENASKGLRESGFAKAFSDSYMDYASENIYLNDNTMFVENVTERGRYICTIKYGENYYSVKECPIEGIVYVSDNVDMKYPIRMTFRSNDHEQNAVMMHSNSAIGMILKNNFSRGVLRFKNLECKNVIFDILSI